MNKIEELKNKLVNELVLLNSEYGKVKIEIEIEEFTHEDVITEFYRVDAIYNGLKIRQYLPINYDNDSTMMILPCYIRDEIIKHEGVK